MHTYIHDWFGFWRSMSTPDEIVALEVLSNMKQSRWSLNVLYALLLGAPGARDLQGWPKIPPTPPLNLRTTLSPSHTYAKVKESLLFSIMIMMMTSIITRELERVQRDFKIKILAFNCHHIIFLEFSILNFSTVLQL